MANLRPSDFPNREHANPGDQYLGSFYSDYNTGKIYKVNESPTMEKEFHLNIATDKEGVIKFLTGKAEDPMPRPKSLSASGILTAPFNYYLGRKDILDQMKERCSLLISVDGKFIKLYIDDKSAVATDQITGTITDNKSLSEWAINTAKRYTVREFVNFVKQRKYQFVNGEQANQLISELLTWHVKVEKEVKDFNDNRGNSLSSFETRITQIKLMDHFQLNIPVFTGYPKQIFTVEIGVEPTTNGVNLFLISDELAEMMPQLIDTYIGDELKKFEDAGFNCSRIFQ